MVHKQTGVNYLYDFTGIAQRFEQHVVIHPILLESQLMVREYLLVAHQSLGRNSPRAHGYAINRNVACTNAVNKEQTQQQVEIRRYFVARVVAAKLFVHLASAVKTGMSRHEAQAHPAAVKQPRRVITHAFF